VFACCQIAVGWRQARGHHHSLERCVALVRGRRWGWTPSKGSAWKRSCDTVPPHRQSTLVSATHTLRPPCQHYCWSPRAHLRSCCQAPQRQAHAAAMRPRCDLNGGSLTLRVHGSLTHAPPPSQPGGDALAHILSFCSVEEHFGALPLVSRAFRDCIGGAPHAWPAVMELPGRPPSRRPSRARPQPRHCGVCV
jgi:hypothetical protein